MSSLRRLPKPLLVGIVLAAVVAPVVVWLSERNDESTPDAAPSPNASASPPGQETLGTQSGTPTPAGPLVFIDVCFDVRHSDETDVHICAFVEPGTIMRDIVAEFVPPGAEVIRSDYPLDEPIPAPPTPVPTPALPPFPVGAVSPPPAPACQGQPTLPGCF